MHIIFECSGGFANLQLTYHANTEEFSQELKEEILRLVKDSGFFEIQQSKLSPSSGVPDAICYRLTLSEGGGKNTLSFTDVTAPKSLRPLVAFLRKLAIEERK